MAVNTVFVIVAGSVIAALAGVWYMNLVRQKREQRRLEHLEHRQEELDALLKKLKEEKPGTDTPSAE